MHVLLNKVDDFIVSWHARGYVFMNDRKGTPGSDTVRLWQLAKLDHSLRRKEQVEVERKIYLRLEMIARMYRIVNNTLPLLVA